MTSTAHRAALVAVTCAAAAIALHASPQAAAAAAPQLVASPFAVEVIRLVNVERAALGLPALGTDRRLFEASEGHADWMASTGTLSHRGAGGSTVADRATQAGYPYTALGEFLAQGHTTPAMVVGGRACDVYCITACVTGRCDGWMQSDAHRRIIMGAGYRDIGVAYVVGSGTLHHWWAGLVGNSVGPAEPIPTRSPGSPTTQASATATAGPIRTATATPTALRTTKPSPTVGRIVTATRTATPSATATRTPLRTATPSATPPRTATATPTALRTTKPSPTVGRTATATRTPLRTATPSATPRRTATATPTALRTTKPSPTVVAPRTATAAASRTPTAGASLTPTVTSTPGAPGGSVVGRVLTSDGVPRAGVAIHVDGVQRALTDAAGRFTVEGLLPGHRAIEARLPGALTSRAEFEMPADQGLLAGDTVLLLGDVYPSGVIDIVDVLVLSGQRGRCAGSPGYHAPADLDASGCVDARDVDLAVANLGRVGPTAWGASP